MMLTVKKNTNKDFSKYDTISLYSNNANGVKIIGSVIKNLKIIIEI